MGEKFAKLKEENKILVMLAFYSISLGIWNNFKQIMVTRQQYGHKYHKQNIKCFRTVLCYCFTNIFK